MAKRFRLYSRFQKSFFWAVFTASVELAYIRVREYMYGGRGVSVLLERFSNSGALEEVME